MLGVEFADGQRATHPPTAAGRGQGPTQPRLQQQSASGLAEVTSRWWLTPLPPPGPLVLTCAWPAYGIRDARATISAELLHQAAARARPIGRGRSG